MSTETEKLKGAKMELGWKYESINDYRLKKYNRFCRSVR